jgi:hypothetical protein
MLLGQLLHLRPQRLQQRVLALARTDAGAHPRQQLLGGEGFVDVILHTLPEQFDAQRIVGLGGQHEDRHVRHFAMLAQFAHHPVAVHPGHHHVADDQVGMEGQGHVQALLAVEGGGDAVVLAQHAGNEAVHVCVVLDHQHERPVGCPRDAHRHGFLHTQLVGGRRFGGFVEGRWCGQQRRSGRSTQGQADGEHGAPSGSLGNSDRPTVQGRQFPHDRQSKSRAAGHSASAAVALAERLEDGLPHLRRHAGAAVLHVNERAIGLDRQPDRYDSAVRRGPERIG